ncbi:hypothetical protein HHI36_016457, partial [Cryptolaemus montrouzieri]
MPQPIWQGRLLAVARLMLNVGGEAGEETPLQIGRPYHRLVQCPYMSRNTQGQEIREPARKSAESGVT